MNGSSMLGRIRSFFETEMSLKPGATRGRSGPGVGGETGGERRLHVAACALLLELVHADDEFSVAEREHFEASLRRHFDLDDATARELIELAQAERTAAVDLYQFTALIRSSYDIGQKTVLAEVMWGLVLADGQIAEREAYLLRRIAALLELKPGYLADARRRAEPPLTEGDGPA